MPLRTAVPFWGINYLKFEWFAQSGAAVLWFTLCGLLLDTPRSQVSSLLPPGSCFNFMSRIDSSIPTARRCSSYGIQISAAYLSEYRVQ